MIILGQPLGVVNENMSISVTVRMERPGDVLAISRITELAFRSNSHSSHTEQFILDELRRGGALSVSLVAEVAARIVGHIAFSPVRITDGSKHWVGLGPVSVTPKLQGQGIGQTLVHAGLAALRAIGAEGCVVLGEPSFYGRFGFSSRPECVLEGVPRDYFLSLSFGKHFAAGTVTYHEAFGTQG